MDGKIRVGLSLNELEKLGKLGKKVLKCSRRDIALVVAQKGNGATTVSGQFFHKKAYINRNNDDCTYGWY